MLERSKHSIIAFTALLVIAPALARAGEGAQEYTQPGPYLGVGVTYARDIFESEVERAFGVPVDVDPSLGAHAIIGYRWLSFLATELEYEWIDNFDVAVAGIDVLTLSAQTLTANVKAILPLWRVQPYLLAGAGATRWEIEDQLGLGISDNEIAFAGRAGVGFDFHLARSVVLNTHAGVVLTTQSVDGLPGGDIGHLFYLVSAGAGLQYNFSGLFGSGD